jgi:hypothetical protein
MVMVRDDAAPALPPGPGSPVHAGLAARRTGLSRLLALLAGVLVVAAFAATVVASSSPDVGDPVLTITNTSAEPLEVSVGGDRVRIIAGYDTEFLDLPPAVWAWPRRIAVRRWPHGELLLEWRADLSDLADNHWRLRIL